MSMDDYSEELRTQTALILASALGGRELYGGWSSRRVVQEDLDVIRQTLQHSEYLPGDRDMTTWKYTVRVRVEIEREPVSG